MKNSIISTIVLLFGVTDLFGQRVYEFDSYYKFTHHSIWATPYAVNNDLDSSLGGVVDKSVMTVNSQMITIESENQRFDYVIDSLEMWTEDYVIFYTTCEKLNDLECTFYVLNDQDRTLIYNSWSVGNLKTEGWQSVSE